MDETLMSTVQCIIGFFQTSGIANTARVGEIRNIIGLEKRKHVEGRIGLGWASGENHVRNAVYMAISSPFLQRPVKEFWRLLINIAIRTDISSSDRQEILLLIADHADLKKTCVYYGSVVSSKDQTDEFRVTIISLFDN